MNPETLTAACRLHEVLRAAAFFMTDPQAAKAMPLTASALVEIAENMAGELVDALDGVGGEA